MRRPRIRPKTVKRLLILAVAAVATSATIGGVYLVRQHAREAHLSQSRAAGMNAYTSGHFADAVTPLHDYLIAHPDDVDAMFALASSRISLDPQNRNTLSDARTWLQQLLLIQPNHLAAQHELLELDEQTGMSQEQFELASALLVNAPNDVAALHGRALSLSRLGRDAEAVPAWRAYVAADPTDVRGQLQLLAAMRRAGASSDELVVNAQKLADANAGDARYTLPLAEVLREAGRDTEGLTLLRSLAAKPPTDEAMLIELVGAFDRARAFDDAEQLLTRSADTLGSTAVTTALVERLWQSGRTAQVIDLTDKILKTGRRDSGILALRALALASSDRRPEAMSLANELTARPQDPIAQSWHDALACEFSTPPLSATARVRSLRSAVAHDPENGIAQAWLGRALAGIGEVDQAAAAYRESARRMPSWAQPCVELAELMRAAGRTPDAIVAAKAALLRSPNSPAAQVAAARVRFASLADKPDPGEQAALLTFVSALRKQLPNEPSLTSMEVSLLSKANRTDEAEQLVRAALAAAPTAAMLAELYAADRSRGLGLSDAIFAQASMTDGLTAGLVSRRALDLADDGHPEAALALTREQAARHPNDVDWALTDARIRTRLDDASATDAWRRLIASNGSSLTVLCAAIDDNAPLAGGREARGALIDRLKSLSGDDSVGWRLREARFLADSTDIADVRQAMTLATELVRQQPSRPELRVLLARVLIKLDGSTTALEHLRAAHEQAPSDASIGLELAASLRREGRLAEAVPVLRQIASVDIDSARPDASEIRMRVAYALLDAGLPDVAAQMLGRAAAQRALDAAGRLAYAQALAAAGDDAAATAAFKVVVDGDNPTADALAADAIFEHTAGNTAAADASLARLTTLPDSATRDRAIAHYHVAAGNIPAARAAYAAALPQAPDATIACEAIAFEFGQNDVARADAILRAAELRFADDAGLRRERLELAARRSETTVASDDALARLIALLAADPSARTELDALIALRDARREYVATPALADALTKLAERYPASFDAAQAAINANVEANQLDAAAGLAHRLLLNFAGRPDAYASAARTLARCGQLPAARRAAEQWRTMAPASTREADGTLASIAIAAGDASRAVTLLTPYRATLDASRDEGLALPLAQALARTNHVDEAFHTLESGLQLRPAVRAMWLTLVLDGSRSATGSDGILPRLSTLNAATPPSATEERLQLANGCFVLATRGLAGAAASGLTALDPVIAEPDAPVVARVLRGELLRANGDPTTAEAVLRDAVKLAPGDPAAKNSLAYVLLSAKPDAARIAEADGLASEAVRLANKEAAFRDTAARAAWAAGRTDDAARIFREALRLDPRCLDSMVGLAALEAMTGKTAEAHGMLPAIQNQLAGEPLPVHLRGEFKSLQDARSAARD